MDGLFSEILYRIEKNEATVLVSIIADHGSAPRGTGSQMLVGEKGRLWGTVGGGAGEMRSVERCTEVLRDKKSQKHTFYLHRNSVEDIGSVCGGDVTVWFEYVEPSEIWVQIAHEALLCIEQNRPAYLCLSLTGQKPALMAVDGTALVGEKPTENPNSGENAALQGDWFFMPLGMAHRAILFGAGHVTRALVPVLQSVGFRVVVFDDRPEYTDPADFPGAIVICGDFLRIEKDLTICDSDFVAVMTSGHKHDLDAELFTLREGHFAYLGVIGSRAKIASVNARLLDEGITKEQIDRVHTPIGTAIKAVTPAEIAVSIAGEMICVRATLREGNGDGMHHRCPV